MSAYNPPDNTHWIDNAKIGIVASRFNHEIVDSLLDACLNTLKDSGVQQQDITVIRVPGAFELPVTVQHLAQHIDCQAVIALGTVIRGETPHFTYISSQCAHGLAQVSLAENLPVIFGVLTADTRQQAMERAGHGKINKGIEAAQAAIDMIHTFRQIAHK